MSLEYLLEIVSFENVDCIPQDLGSQVPRLHFELSGMPSAVSLHSQPPHRRRPAFRVLHPL